MPLFMNFTKREIQQLQLYARGQRHLADNRADGDVDFWDGLLFKLATIHEHPMCCWCDSRDWTLDDPDSIPDNFGCQHSGSA